MNKNKKGGDFLSKMFIGTIAVYNGGNSKNITVPKPILKELEKKGLKQEEIKEVDIYYDRDKKEMTVSFIVNDS